MKPVSVVTMPVTVKVVFVVVPDPVIVSVSDKPHVVQWDMIVWDVGL